MGPVGYFETSEKNYPVTRRHIPEERRPQVYRTLRVYNRRRIMIEPRRLHGNLEPRDKDAV
jgi:hypothetical protein